MCCSNKQHLNLRGQTHKGGLSFFFWLCLPACGILVPQPGIEPGPSAVRAQSSNHWTTREFPKGLFLTLVNMSILGQLGAVFLIQGIRLMEQLPP